MDSTRMKKCSRCGGWMAPNDEKCLNCGAPSPYQFQGYSGESELPEGIKGWSWGAFIFGWVWAIFNRTWIGLLGLIPIVGFVISIVLGFKGREWAWRNKQWDSVEHFNRVQRNWSIAGLILLVVALIGGFAAGAFESSVDEYRLAAQRSLNELERQVEDTQREASSLQPANAGLDIHDLLGANRSYVDQALGVARSSFEQTSEYNTQGCQVYVKFEQDHASEVSVNLRPGCSVSLWLIDKTQTVTNRTRIGDLTDGVLEAYYDCLSGCGNAYDPALHFGMPASRASNGIYHYLSTIEYEIPVGLVDTIDEPWESGQFESNWVDRVFTVNRQSKLSSITAGLTP